MKLNSLKLLLLGVFIVIFCLPKKAFSQAVVFTGLTGNAPTYLTQGATNQVVFGFSIQVPANKTFNPGVLHIATSNGLNGFVSGNLIRTTAATPSLAISSPQGTYGLAINTTLDVNSFPSLTAGTTATTFYYYVVLSVTTTANTPPASVYFSLPLAALISQNGYTGGITVTNLATPTTYYFGVNPPTVSSVSNCGAATLTMTASDASPAGGTYKWYSAATGGTTLQNSTLTTYTPYVNSTISYYVSYTSGTIESARTAVTATIYPTVSSPFTGVYCAYPFNAGSTADITGNGNTAVATYQTAAQTEGTSTGPPTASADRFGTANSAYTFDGKGQYMSTTTDYPTPGLQTFTLSVWFKTSTTFGGKIIGWDASQGPGSGQFDRHIYMTNTGTLIFGVYSGATHTIVSPKSYNDGNWHHVVVTLGPTYGSVMYVDGTSVASNAAYNAAETDNGYWRIGGDNLSGWTSAPTSYYFAGQIDDIGIYTTEQTAAQVASSDNLNLIGFPPTASCAGNSITFSAQTITGATYTWTDPSGNTMTGQNPTFTNSLPGNYTLMVTGGPGGCSSTATAPSNVNAAPSATFTVSSTTYPGVSPTITYTGTDPTTSTYAWTFTGATPATGSGQTPPAITYSATGTYTISLSVTNANGCITTTSHTISVVALPLPTLSYTPSTDNYYDGVTISTLAPTSTFVGTLGSYGAAATFGSANTGPKDIAFDPSGNVYVTDIATNTIRKFNSAGTFTANYGTGISLPYAISFDAAGNSYITNNGTSSIIKITAAGVQSTLITGLNAPYGNTVDAAGNIYVANYGAGTVAKYSSAGTLLSTITDAGAIDVAVDNNGNIYILSATSGTVTKYNAAGVLQSVIVSGLSMPSYGFTIDASGNMYITDTGNNRILEYNTAGTLFNTINTGTGTSPKGVSTDASGNLYVSLYGTNTVVKYAATGGYFINKPLPAGLSFDSTTGNITGTPTAISPLTAYTVTAFNTSGSASTVVNISVSIIAPTVAAVTQCGAGATLTASGGLPAGGTYNWYTAATGGTAFQSSTSTTLANIQSTATYYVSYTYSGTESTRTSVTATINPIVSAPYSGAYLSYPFNGNTNDVSGTSNNGVNNGATLTTDRYGASNAAYSFNGTSSYMDNSVLDNNPLNYTVSIWFQTTTTTGGSLIGLESGNYDDRILYMTNSGQIYWGLYPGTLQTINTTASYNDGNWHHVIVTVSSTAGSTLYVDGISQATNAAMTTGDGTNGYWQIGYSLLSAGWTNYPTSNYFTGSLDDIAVYHRVLSSAEIASSNNLNQIYVGTASACGALSFTAPTITGATYTWTDPNSNTLTGQTVSFPGAVAGNYTLTVTGGPGGCSSSATLTPVISAAVASAFFVPASIAVSTNTTVTLYSSVTGSTYSWNFGGGTSSSGTTGTGPFTVQWSTTGVKTITLTVTTAGGCVTTTTNIITVTTNGYGNYTYSRNLTLNNAAVGISGNLSSFPVLLSIQNNDLIVTGTCADKIQNPTGPNYDFAFFDPSAQSELYYQVESYNSTTGTLLVWVRVPTMYAATNNTIYFYYGAKVPSVTHNAAFSALTWNTDYQSVYHFNESAYSPTTADGTSNGRNATLVGFSSANYVAAGKIGSCYSFGNVADMESAAEPASTVFTLSAWVNTTSTGLDEKVLCNQNSSGTASGGYKLGVYYGSAETEAVYTSDRSSTSPTEPALTTNTWYYIQGVYDGSTISTYVNGVQYKKYSASATSSFSNILYIGIGEGKSYPFSGMIDEPRVSNVAKSSDWIKMEYSNQNNPTAFIISSSAPTCNYATGGSIPGEISYTWTGTTSTDPTVATNWINSVTSANALPPFDGTESLNIPAGLSKYPALTASESAYGLTIANGASLSLNGFTLSVACHIYNGSGGSILYGSTSTAGGITFNGSLATQYYYGTTTGIANVGNLTVNNSAAGTVDITGGAFGVNNILTLTSGNLFIDNTNSGSLTLLSTATNSGSVAAIPSAYNITGNVNVQRYITSGAGTRGYRLLTSPVNVNSSIAGTGNLGLTYLNTDATFNSTTYHGAYTQGPGTGFTYNGSAHPIIYLYDQSQPTYNGSFTGGKDIGVYTITGSTGSPAYGVITQGTTIASSAVNIPVANSYLLYFVGSDLSSVVSNTRVPDATTLTATGYLNQGTIPFVFWKSASTSLPYNVTTGTTNYGLFQVGNPYPSTITLATLYTDNYNASTNPISPSFYELIPAGNYVSYNASNGHVSDTRASQYIVSGQGFLAQTTATGQTITFKEDQKVAYSSSNPFLESIAGPALADAHIINSTPSAAPKSNADALTLLAPVNTNSGNSAGLHVQLTLDSADYAQTGVYFNNTSVDKYLSSEDAVEVDGGTPLVFLSSYSADSVKLSINTMGDYGQGKRARLYVNAVNSGVYTLSLADITDIDTSNYNVFIIDNKLQDSLDIIHYKTYSFNLNLSDTTTFGSNRFVLAIDHKPIKPYELSTFAGQKVTTGVQLKWTAVNAGNYTGYTLQKQNSTGGYDSLYSVQSNASITAYGFIDTHPIIGNNVYRLQQNGISGAITYSALVTIGYNSTTPNGALTLYPNPAKSILNVSLTSSAINSSYVADIYNSLGVKMNHQTVTGTTWTNDVSSYKLGVYIMEIKDSNGNIVGQAKFVKVN